MKKQAEQLIKDFVTGFLAGDWEQFKHFDLNYLKTSDKFGCPGRNFDCDDSNLMRAVYVVLWEKEFPYLNMDNFGTRKQYRGDTMNTFNTMSGKEVENQPGFFRGAEKYHPSDEFREKVRQFDKLCRNIGNYVVLPNYFACRTNLNCYRGTNAWRDFFDRFLIELHKVLTGDVSQDETLQELVKVNNFAFQNFQGEDGFRKFSQILLLDDYCDNSGKPQKIFAMNYHWMNEHDPEQYFRDAEIYLEKTEKIIRSRAEKMISMLKENICGAM